MKIAYLISAHCDPVHLERLIQSLNENATFFIHLDAKADIRQFARLRDIPEVHILETRINTLWGDITQVHYQIALLRACLQSGQTFDRICTLSGLDYPLVSNQAIREFLTAHLEKEFIQGIDMSLQRKEIQKGYTIYRPQFFCKYLSNKTNSRIRILLRKLIYACGYRKKLTFTVAHKKYAVFKGSDWWCITPELATYLLQELDAHPEILHYFATAFAPSELVWQTLVFNSPYAGRALLFTDAYVSLAALTPLHYIYYEPVIKVLTEKDWDTLYNSGKLFCRKTCTGISDRLMDMIDTFRKK